MSNEQADEPKESPEKNTPEASEDEAKPPVTIQVHWPGHP